MGGEGDHQRQKLVRQSGIQAAGYVMEVCGTIRLKTKHKQTSLPCETSRRIERQKASQMFRTANSTLDPVSHRQLQARHDEAQGGGASDNDEDGRRCWSPDPPRWSITAGAIRSAYHRSAGSNSCVCSASSRSMIAPVEAGVPAQIQQFWHGTQPCPISDALVAAEHQMVAQVQEGDRICCLICSSLQAPSLQAEF